MELVQQQELVHALRDTPQSQPDVRQDGGAVLARKAVQWVVKRHFHTRICELQQYPIPATTQT